MGDVVTDEELARRRERVDAAISSFGMLDFEYHEHVMACDACAGGMEEMCIVGKRLFEALMAEERRAGER